MKDMLIIFMVLLILLLLISSLGGSIRYTENFTDPYEYNPMHSTTSPPPKMVQKNVAQEHKEHKEHSKESIESFDNANTQMDVSPFSGVEYATI